VEEEKSFKMRVKETFTKSRDQRYEELSSEGKVKHWIVFFIVLAIVVGLGIVKYLREV
jgi:hypothetical protein